MKNFWKEWGFAFLVAFGIVGGLLLLAIVLGEIGGYDVHLLGWDIFLKK